MDCCMRTVKYVSEDLPCVTSNGLDYFTERSLHDVFHDSIIRNRVILRFDLMRQLIRFFDKETIDENRMEIYRLLVRDYTDEEFSNALISLAGEDVVFARALRNMFESLPEGSTFGDYIIDTLLTPIHKKMNDNYEFYKGLPTFVVGDDFGYLYISIPDKYEPVLLLDEIYEEVSNAKSWDGQIERV